MSASAGQKRALDERFPAVYDQLRRIAHSMLGSPASATVTATGVVHDAYARLAVSGKLPNVTEDSFKRIAAYVMRQILCDAARRRLAAKRGGQQQLRVTADENLQDRTISLERIILVNDFLDHLHHANSRQATVVELLFFGGLTIPEVAAELSVSEATVERDWRTARAWLSTQGRPPL